MPMIVISEETVRMLRQAVRPGYSFRQTAVQIEDGRWVLDVDEDILEMIEQERVPGEPDDAVLQRLLLAAKPS